MKLETPSGVQSEELTAFFSALTAVSEAYSEQRDSLQELVNFFKEISDFTPAPGRPESPSPRASDLSAFFSMLRLPIELEKERGGMLNFWTITGLKHNEVRNAGALAGLWRHGFGGNVSRAFAAHFLEMAIPKLDGEEDLDWHKELRQEYAVRTEVNPLGDMADRVDLVIETSLHLIGIEIKIHAGLGNQQLERYRSSLRARAKHIQKSWHLILLAPNKPSVPDVPFYYTSWKDVTAAAQSATNCRCEDRTLIHHLIANFGDYVSRH